METQRSTSSKWLQRDDADPLYDPFRRFDQYGTMGVTPQPWWEYVRLGLLAITLLPVKFLGTLVSVFGAYATTRVCALLPASKRHAVQVTWLKFWARAVLFCVGFVSVRWRVVDDGGLYYASNIPRTLPRKRALDSHLCCAAMEGRKGVAVGAVLSNHIGWADILVHMSHYLPSFVARRETADLHLIGAVAQAMDCIFVDRERGSKVTDKPEDGTQFVGVATRVKERMQKVASPNGVQLQPMLLFPEGTTTNGRYLLPFRTGAFLAGAPVQPVILKYGQNRISPSWETIEAKWHIFLMLCNALHWVNVIELPVYVPSDEEKADPAKYANNVRNYMMRYSKCIDSSATFDDKRMYHARLKGLPPPEITLRKKAN